MTLPMLRVRGPKLPIPSPTVRLDYGMVAVHVTDETGTSLTTQHGHREAWE